VNRSTRSTVVIVLAIFLVGVLAGLALAEFLVSATAALGLAVVVVVIGLIAYWLIRRRIRPKGVQPSAG
jgi:dipeptide/tripeptide permease